VTAFQNKLDISQNLSIWNLFNFHNNFHTHKACSDLYFEIVMNMKNHEKKKGRNLGLFSCQEFRLHQFNYLKKKRSENVLNIMKK